MERVSLLLFPRSEQEACMAVIMLITENGQRNIRQMRCLNRCQNA